MSPIFPMKTHFRRQKRRHGFTLAEVALAMAVTAGLLAILTSMMSVLTRDVRRLRPWEAWRRPAFDRNSGSNSSNSSSTNTNDAADNDGDDSSAKKITHPLPDANLNPVSRPDETAIPPDPDDPQPPKTDSTTTSGDPTAPQAAPPSN